MGSVTGWMDLSPRAAVYYLCDLGKVAQPPLASLAQQGNVNDLRVKSVCGYKAQCLAQSKHSINQP